MTGNDPKALTYTSPVLTSDVEIIPIQRINEAYERMLKGDVKYRFVIDMASLNRSPEGEQQA